MEGGGVFPGGGVIPVTPELGMGLSNPPGPRPKPGLSNAPRASAEAGVGPPLAGVHFNSRQKTGLNFERFH